MFDTIHEPDVMTHMPFLTRDEAGRRVLFYCRSGPDDVDAATQSRRWKLWVAIEDDPPRRLETGLSDALAECAPKAYQTDGTMPDWEALAQAAEAVRQGAA